MSEADLEMRVQRLESALAELRAIVIPSVVEGPGRAEGAPTAPPGSLDSARDDPTWLALAGTSILIFGGAYLLRALTESRFLPQLAGVALGLAYALVWIFTADRAARAGRRRNAAFHAATAAAIAFPLVWETTTQFKYVSPAVGGACAAFIGVILLVVAWRNDEQAIAWIGSIGSIAVTIALARPDALLPLMISGSVVGAATLHVAIVMHWKFVALPAAVLTNALAAMTVGIPILRGTIANPGEIILALLAFVAVWLAIIILEGTNTFFDIIETSLLLFVGVGGAAVIAATSHQYFIPLAIIYALAALATAKHEWIALYLIAIALLLTASFTVGAAIFAICCFIAALRTKLPGSRVALLTISVLLLFLIAGNGQGALFRTCLLAALAAALALASRTADSRQQTAGEAPGGPLSAVRRLLSESGTVARIILVAGGVKLLAEDVQVESAAKLVLSFASYGLAMLTVARCVRRHTSARRQSLGVPPADTFGCRPKDDTV